MSNEDIGGGVAPVTQEADDPRCACCRRIVGVDLLDGGLCENCYGYVVDAQLDGMEDARTLQAELAAERARGAAMADETGWLVEEDYGLGLHWIALATDEWPLVKTRQLKRIYLDQYRTPVVRVKDANLAIRFARKEDAEAFIKLFDAFLLHAVATEHMWPASLPATTGEA